MKNIAPLIRNKQETSQQSSSNITNLAAVTHDNNTDSIVDQHDDIVLADVPNHSFLSPQKMQGEVIDNDLDDDNDDNDDNNNNNDNNDNHSGVEDYATVYDGRENSVAVHQAKLSASPSLNSLDKWTAAIEFSLPS